MFKLLLTLLALVPAALWAQARVTGTVTDSTGPVVAGRDCNRAAYGNRADRSGADQSERQALLKLYADRWQH